MKLFGPKTDSGWGVPLNLKGADGNANVTRYITREQISALALKFLILNADSETESVENVWLVYLVYEGSGLWHYYSLPGYGINNNTLYTRFHYWTDAYNYTYMHISTVDGPGEEYDSIEIIRIEAGSTDDRTKSTGDQSIVPEDLDVSDYDAVADRE